jgi:hypothetical protein
MIPPNCSPNQTCKNRGGRPRRALDAVEFGASEAKA